MNTLNTIIVDDEEKSRSVLHRLVTSFCPEIKVTGSAENISDAYNLITATNPDLVFLDIQMPSGTGFSLLEKFSEVPFDVIFVTGFDQYAINAIKFSALDYLLKPVDTTELKKAVNRAVNKIQAKGDRQVQIVNLLHNIDPAITEKRISVHKNEKVLLINLTDIMYIEADERYSTIVTAQKEKHTISKTLKEFESFFAEFPYFIRTGRSLMLNTNYIQAYSKDEPCMITMADGKVFEVPRRKKTDILSALKHHPR